MSLFAKQLNAARAARVAVELRTEEVVATESLDGEMEETVDVDSIIDQFATERAVLNAELTGEVSEETPAEPATEALNAEVPEAVATESLEAPSEVVEDTIAQEETPQGVVAEEPAAEPVTEEPATESLTSEEEVTQVSEPVQEEPMAPNEDIPDDATPGGDEEEPIVAEEGTEGNTNLGEDIAVVPPAGVPEVDGKPVEDIDDSGDVDYGDDDEDSMFEEMMILEELGNEVSMIETFGTEMSMMSDSMIAIESFGINPSAVAILQTTGLLSGTVLEAVGCESLGYCGPKDAQTDVALEALGDKLKEKAAQWSAKILSLASGIGSKIMSVLDPIWEKITGVTKTVTGYAWDKAKVGAEYAKAHPYKTILGIVAAIAAVAGIMVFTAGGLPVFTGKLADMTKFGSTLVDKIKAIKWPFGSIKATMSETTGKIVVGVEQAGSAAKSATMSSMGWTKTVVSGINSQLSRAWGAIKTGVKSVGSRGSRVVTSAIEGVKAAPGNIAGRLESIKNIDAGSKLKTAGKMAWGTFGVWAYASMIASIIETVAKLLFSVVAFGLRTIWNTLKAITGAVKRAEA